MKIIGAKGKYLETIFKFSGEFSSSLKDSFDKIEQNIQNTQTKMDKFKQVGENFSKIGNKLTVGVTAPVVGLGVASVKGAMEFEEGVAKVNTMLKLQGEELQKVKDEALDFSSKYKISNDKVTEAMYQGLSAGIQQKDLMNTLGVAAKASKGGFTDLATAIDGITNIINSYGLSMDSADKIANQMLITQNLGKTTFGELASSMSKVTPIAKQANISTEELFSSMAVLTANGIATSESVTGLKAALSNIIKPASQSTKLAAEMGFQFDVTTLQQKGLIGTIQYLTDNLAKLSPEYAKVRDEQFAVQTQMLQLEKAGKANTEEYKNLEKTFMSYSEQIKIMSAEEGSAISQFAQMFGSVEALNSIMVLGSGSGLHLFNRSMQEMRNNTTALDDAFDIMNDTTKNNLEGTIIKLQNTFAKLGEKAIPILTQSLEGVNNLLDKFNNLSPQTQDMIIKIALAAATLGPTLKVVGGGFKMFSTLGKQTSKLTGLAKTLKVVKSSSIALGGGAKIASLGLGALGGVTLGLTAGLGALGVGMAIVNKKTKDNTKSLDLLKQNLGDDAEKVRDFSNRVDDLGLKMKSLSAMDIDLSAEAKATFLGEVELIVSDVQNQIDKKLQEDLKKAEQIGISAEGQETLKNKAEAEKQQVAELQKNIEQILTKVADEGRSILAEEQKVITENMKQLEKFYMVGSGISVEKTESYQKAKGDKSNIRSEDLAEVVKELNAITETEKQKALERKQQITEELELRARANEITKEQMSLQLQQAEEMYSQHLSTIESKRGQELISMFEEYGKLMDYVNIETGTLKSGFVQAMHTMSLAINTQKNDIYTKYADINQISDQRMVKYLQEQQYYQNMADTVTNQLQNMGEKTTTVGMSSGQASTNIASLSTAINTLSNGVVSSANRINVASSNLGATPTPPTQQMPKFAKGGIATKPSIFGEAGPEIAIPLNNSNRSQGLLDMANNLLGRTPQVTSGDNVAITYNVNIANAQNPTEIQGILERDKNKMLKMFEEYEQNKRRVSFA